MVKGEVKFVLCTKIVRLAYAREKNDSSVYSSRTMQYLDFESADKTWSFTETNWYELPIGTELAPVQPR